MAKQAGAGGPKALFGYCDRATNSSVADAKSDGEKTVITNKGYLAILGALLLLRDVHDYAGYCIPLC